MGDRVVCVGGVLCPDMGARHRWGKGGGLYINTGVLSRCGGQGDGCSVPRWGLGECKAHIHAQGPRRVRKEFAASKALKAYNHTSPTAMFDMLPLKPSAITTAAVAFILALPTVHTDLHSSPLPPQLRSQGAPQHKCTSSPPRCTSSVPRHAPYLRRDEHARRVEQPPHLERILPVCSCTHIYLEALLRPPVGSCRLSLTRDVSAQLFPPGPRPQDHRRLPLARLDAREEHGVAVELHADHRAVDRRAILERHAVGSGPRVCAECAECAVGQADLQALKDGSSACAARRIQRPARRQLAAHAWRGGPAGALTSTAKQLRLDARLQQDPSTHHHTHATVHT
eukprot:364314-Chlamydomonas_euryale.AAC.8